MSITTVMFVAGIAFGSTATVADVQVNKSEVPSAVTKIGVLATHHGLGTSRQLEEAYCMHVGERYPQVECVGLRVEGPDDVINETQYYAEMAQSMELSHLVTITFDELYTRSGSGRRPTYNVHDNSGLLFVATPWGVSVAYNITLLDVQRGELLQEQRIQGRGSFHGMRYYAKEIAQLVDTQVVSPTLSLVQQ